MTGRESLFAARQRLARWLDPGAYAALYKWQQMSEQALVELGQAQARTRDAITVLENVSITDPSSRMDTEDAHNRVNLALAYLEKALGRG